MSDPKERRFLSKLNPKATAGSIVRRGLFSAALMALLYGAAAYFRFNERFRPTWWGFAAFVLVGFFVGMVVEWQDEWWPDDDRKPRS